MSLSLPLYLLLIPYGVFVLVFLFYAFFNLFQLYKHGVNNVRTKGLAMGFIVLLALIFGVTFVAGSMVDWTSALTFSSGNLN